MEYIWKIIRKSVNHPTVALRAMNRFYHNRLRGSPLLRESANPRGTNISDFDWDNAIILDGCRYDTFTEVATFDEEINTRRTKASWTVPFLESNFMGKDLTDTIYITAQFMIRKLDDSELNFHKIIELPPRDEDAAHRPISAVAEDAVATSSRFPDKRVIVHALEPHYPFFDTLSEEEWPKSEPPRSELTLEDDVYDYFRFESGLSSSLVYEAYRRRLEDALPSAVKLARDLPGRSMLTSDHGNMWGERAYPFPVRVWGHPPNTYTKLLTEVPLVFFEDGTRKQPTPEVPEDGMWEQDIASSEVKERLRAIGYR